MLNLWIGLCKGAHGLPNTLRALSFREHCIEQPITLGDKERCKPELVICSRPLRYSLILEWKSGKNTVPDQLQRYGKLSSATLSAVALLPKEAAASFDVVVVGQAQHEETLKLGIQNSGHAFPLLVCDDIGLRLALNSFKSDRLNQAFSPGLAIDMSVAPRSFVPLSETSEDWEVADKVIPEVLKRMHRRDTMIDAETICVEICPLWSIMHRSIREEMQRRVCLALQLAANTEFAAFLYWRAANNGCKVEVVSNPVDFHGNKRSGAYQRLRKASVAFQERMRTGKKYEIQEQLEFFN